MKGYNVTCPDCGAVFDPNERSWYLCLDCGMLFGPDEDKSGHKFMDDPECISSLGTWRRYHSEESAEEGQEEWIQQRRGEHEKTSA